MPHAISCFPFFLSGCHIVQFLTHNLTDKMTKEKSNHFLSSKEIIFNVSEAFEKEQKTGARSFLDRTAEVAGVSRSTVDRGSFLEFLLHNLHFLLFRIGCRDMACHSERRC